MVSGKILASGGGAAVDGSGGGVAGIAGCDEVAGAMVVDDG